MASFKRVESYFEDLLKSFRLFSYWWFVRDASRDACPVPARVANSGCRSPRE
jgi:hypothetical protein